MVNDERGMNERVEGVVDDGDLGHDEDEGEDEDEFRMTLGPVQFFELEALLSDFGRSI
jgi:hypothetical protein